MTNDIKATDLARELGVTVSALLMDADRLIEKTFKKGSYQAVEGMTTRRVSAGSSSYVTISEKLAQALRQMRAESRRDRTNG